MAKHRGKKYLEVAKLVEIGKLYDIREALELVQKTKKVVQIYILGCWQNSFPSDLQIKFKHFQFF